LQRLEPDPDAVIACGQLGDYLAEKTPRSGPMPLKVEARVFLSINGCKPRISTILAGEDGSKKRRRHPTIAECRRRLENSTPWLFRMSQRTKINNNCRVAGATGGRQIARASAALIDR
jgi:hypothetical protein